MSGAVDAYWAQEQHDELAERGCSVCEAEHLNDPGVAMPLCPSCMEDYLFSEARER